MREGFLPEGGDTSGQALHRGRVSPPQPAFLTAAHRACLQAGVRRTHKPAYTPPQASGSRPSECGPGAARGTPQARAFLQGVLPSPDHTAWPSALDEWWRWFCALQGVPVRQE